MISQSGFCIGFFLRSCTEVLDWLNRKNLLVYAGKEKDNFNLDMSIEG